MSSPTPPTAPAASPRLYFLDWLRIAAFAVLVLYHVGMYYVRWDFHVKSPFAAEVGPWLEPWMRLTEPWRMSLLFIVSGAVTALNIRSAEFRSVGPDQTGGVQRWGSVTLNWDLR